MRTASRTDVFYGGVWAPRTSVAWTDARRARAQARNDLVRAPAPFLMDADRAWALAPRELATKSAVLAVLDAMRTATTEQLAAMTGRSKLALPHAATLQRLFAMGLLDYGSMAGPFGGARSAPATQVWRPSVPGRSARARFERELLTWPEWVRTTGGRPWVSSRQSSRHDVLTTELLLRLAEFVPQVSGVLGEKFSALEELLFTSWGREPSAPASGVADATVLRRDGLRIAVETTVSLSRGDHRAMQYAQAMSSGSTATQGTVVLFVVVTDAEDASGVARKTRLQVSQAVRAYRGSAAERMFVVDWQDWFPAEGAASDAFVPLRAHRYDVPSGEWVSVDLATAAFELPEGARVTAATAATLLQSPHWLRAHARPLGLHDARARRWWGGEPPYPDEPAGAVPASMLLGRLAG